MFEKHLQLCVLGFRVKKKNYVDYVSQKPPGIAKHRSNYAALSGRWVGFLAF
jgi:hypothetical protein